MNNFDFSVPAFGTNPTMPKFDAMALSALGGGGGSAGWGAEMDTSALPTFLPDASGGGLGGIFEGIGGMAGLGKIAQGLASLGSLYGAFQGTKLAKDQLNFTKKAYQTNLDNSTKSYNTALEDRIRARHVMEGKGASAADSYLKKHSL